MRKSKTKTSRKLSKTALTVTTQRKPTWTRNADRTSPSNVSDLINLLQIGVCCAGKMEELTRENAKILQKIVEARQINVKARH